MASGIAILRELHRLRRHAKGLQDEIERGPRLVRARQNALAKQDEDLKAAHERLNEAKVKVRQGEGALKATNDQVAKFQQQMRDITSKKEYDALQHEIADARKRSGQIEDEILESMTRVDEQAARVPEIEKALAAAKDEHANFEKTTRERAAVLSEELKKTQAQLKEVEESLPPDFRQHYERLVGAMGEDALALVRDNICSACHTNLTLQQRNDLLAGRLVTCKSCGRIAYTADEA